MYYGPDAILLVLQEGTANFNLNLTLERSRHGLRERVRIWTSRRSVTNGYLIIFARRSKVKYGDAREANCMTGRACPRARRQTQLLGRRHEFWLRLTKLQGHRPISSRAKCLRASTGHHARKDGRSGCSSASEPPRLA